MSTVITRCFVVLLVVSSSLPASCSTAYQDRIYLTTTTPRPLTWAQLIQSKEKLAKAPVAAANQVPPSTYLNEETEHYIPSQPHTEKKNVVGTPVLVSPNQSGQIDPTQLQKRGLDFLYHKFVEPRIHKDLEPRPSLIEDLIAAFDEHVMKDLRAWNLAGTASHHENYPEGSASSKASKENQHKISSSHGDYELPSKAKKPITSIAHVEEGKIDDTFLLTDDSGETHVITVDDIIGSLSQLNDETISDLLLSSPPIDPSIDRMDKVSYLDNSDKSQKTVKLPDIVDSVQYSRKGVDNNDVIIIENEDGDTRLITVKDLKTMENKNTNANKRMKSRPVQSSAGKNPNVDSVVNKNTIITLEDLLNLNLSGQPTLTHPNIFESTQRDTFSISRDRPQSLRTQTKLNSKENSNQDLIDPLANIRQSLEKIQQKQTNILPSSLGLAPNSPPLNAGTPGSLTKFIPFQRTASLKPVDEPSPQQTGIKEKLSSFFSRLIRKPVKEVNVNRQSEDKGEQFVHLMIPNSDSNAMEELTIPLPKPIHFKGRKISYPATPVQSANEKVPVKAQSRSFLVDSSSDKKHDKVRPKMKVSKTATAENILKTAKIPDSVRQKLLQQINEKESKNPHIPVLKHLEKASKGRKEIDRFFVVKNKSKRKDIKFPIGYTYDISPEEYTEFHDLYATQYQHAYDAPHEEYIDFQEPYNSPYLPTYDGPSEEYTEEHDPYATPQLHHSPYQEEHKHDGSDDEEPLVDFSLLADLVFLSKIGDSNKSFSFPKIGDSKRFVDTRKHYH